MIQKVRTRILAALAIAAVAVGTLGTTVAGAADNSTPQGALPLAASTSAALPGANGGNFLYFKFNYPGDWRKITLSLNATPNDQAVLQYVGFNLYGPDPGRVYASANASKDANPSATVDFSSPQGGEYVVQVYNYVPNPETVVTFTLTATGLPQATTPPPAAAPAPPAAPVAAPAGGTITQSVGDPTSPETAPRIGSAVIRNSLAGQPGGRFHFYKFTHKGDGSTITVGLSVTPNDAAILQYTGFKLYGPEAGREYASAIAQQDANPSAAASVPLTQAGDYVIQVFNYVPNADFVANYVLLLTGLPEAAPAAVPTALPAPIPTAAPAPAAAPSTAAPAAPTGDNSTPQGAFPLRGNVNFQLAGANGGRFAYYKFTYKGDGSTVTINLNVSPNDPAILQYTGFKLYGPDPGREYASANALKDANPSASATLSNNQPGEYIVQVYNYVPNPETVVTFALSATGM